MPFALTIFLSAFLLFIVQLILGKFILPWFGGFPAVWTTCMLFFQVLLLAGYAYAHLLGTRLSPAKQARVHLGLLWGSALAMAWLWWQWKSPILPPDAWRPENPNAPVAGILKLLGASIGLPFLLLAATSPLLQNWFSLSTQRQKPYRLYALSNAGSLLGLLAYPFLVEPLTRLSLQAQTWGALYLVFAVMGSICALRAARTSMPAVPCPVSETSPSAFRMALWLALATLSSAMLLAVTNQLCQEVATIPLLWVWPLTLYLASFIVCFSGARWYWRGPLIAALALLTVVIVRQGIPPSLFGQITYLSGLLLTFCLVCHGELARLKPGPAYATRFYLMIALGGALGGVFVALLAPAWFKGYWEFPLTHAVGAVVVILVLWADPESFLNRVCRWPFLVAALLAVHPIVETALNLSPLGQWNFYWRNQTTFLMGSALAVAVLLLWLVRHRQWAQSKHWGRAVAVITTALTLTHAFQASRSERAKEQTRNFYGVVRVMENQVHTKDGVLATLQLMHGQVNHGIQFQDEPWRRQPVSYYTTNSGIELAFRLHPRRMEAEPLRIGVMGLGVGTLAAFAQPGDRVRFYEINPDVIALCEGPQPRFTYLPDCRGETSVVAGDARLALETEWRNGQSGGFDILVMDAFAGGTIPVHLLTVEAFATYRHRLRDDRSVIAVNVSNHYLDLSGLMTEIGRRFNWGTLIISSRGAPPDQTPSRWCLLTPNRAWLQQEAFQQRAETRERAPGILWTDDFSNLFRVLR